MRSKNCNGKKLRFALIASLIACFVLVFGATLALGIFDVNVESEEQTANVAYADVMKEGGSSPLDLGDLSALAFGFPGITSSKDSWSKTVSLTGIVFDKSGSGNVSFYKGEDNVMTFTNKVSNNTYGTYSDRSITPETNAYSCVNFNLGTFLTSLITNNTQYTVTVSLSVTANYDNFLPAESHNHGIVATDNAIDASSSLLTSGSTAMSLTLTKEQPYFAFYTHMYLVTEFFNKPEVSVTFNSLTITINQANTTYNESTSKVDGGNPVVSNTYSNLANAYSTNPATGTDCEPYVTTKDSSLWPVYDQDLESILSANLDSMSNGSGTMQSYTNKAIGTINGSNYYKYSQVEYVDTYNYHNTKTLQGLIDGLYDEDPELTVSQMQIVSGAGNKYISAFDKNTGVITWGTTNANYCSGIKSVQVGETVINCYAASAGANFTVDEEVVGYAYIRKIDNGRVVVQIYMYKNANVTTIVKDFGEGVCSSTVVFKGIDPDAPLDIAIPSFSTDDEVISMSTTLTKWVRTKTLTVDVIDNIPDSEYDSTTYTPYVWFYSVKKSNASASAIPAYDTYSSYDGTNGIKAQGLRPIAVTSFNSFVYNFEDGTAEGINTGSQISGGTGCTGSGYYRFTFYVCDLAGNIMTGDPISFYVMVDYETPFATTTLDSSGSGSITSATNGKWSTTGETLKINLVKKNISGNTLQFDTNEGTNTLIFQNDSIVSINGVAINSNVISSYPIMGLVNSANVAIHVETDGTGGTNITFIIPTTALFAWETSFVMFAGTNISEYENLSTNVDEVLFDGTSFSKNSVVYQGINFTSDIKVYIDNTSPAIPLVANYDGIDYLKDVANKDELTLDVTDSRQWFTASTLKMDSILTFEDAIVDTDFANGLKVYYGVKTIDTASKFDSVKSFITQYLNGSLSFATNSYVSFFDRAAEYTGDKLDGSETEISIDFLQNAGANMRILVVWAIDQAGNRSSNVKIYYVLADPNTYTVKASLYANAIVGATASLTLTNDDEVSSTSFVRGEKITMTFSLNDGYVPYQLTKIGKTDTSVLINETAKIDWTVLSGFESLIKKESTDEGVIVMSYIYDDLSTFATLDKTVTLEFKQRLVVGYTITNTSVRYTGMPAVVPITFTDSRSEEFFTYKFRIKSTAEELSDTPKIPGEYQVLVTIPKNNASFVTDDVETVDYKDFTITNGIATVKAISTSSYYGDMPDLKYTVEGIEAEALQAMKDAGSSVFRGSLKLNVSKTMAEYKTLNVGRYAIIQNQEFFIQYYNVTFEGEYHEILQKVINVDVLSGNKVFGSTDGLYQFSVDYSQVGSVTILNDLLGINYSTKNDLEHTAIYETSTFIAREAGENVGSYSFINNPSAFAISSENYVINIENIGNYSITQKTIVIDAGGNEYTFATEEDAETASLLSALEIAYTLGNNTQYASDISGKLALGTQLSKTSGGASDPYLFKYVYKITLGTIVDTDNLHFVLDNESAKDEYTIYVALPNSVIISLKAGEAFTLTYGEAFTQSLVDFDTNSSKFKVVGATVDVDFDSIEWTLENAGLSAAYPNVGTYFLSATSVVLKKQGAAVAKINDEAYVVVVIPFAITIVPAEIIVEPIANNDRKEYATLDSEYGIGIDIVSIAGHAVYDANKNEIYHNHGGATINVIKGYVNGLFARAIYDKDDNFIAFGAKNDAATDNNGVVIGGTNYYSFGVYKEFTSKDANGNYVVKTQIDTTKRLSINPSKIVIKASDFKGTSKVYDGNTLVKYPAGETAIDINSKLKVATDRAIVTYIANYVTYDGVGLDSAVGKKKIVFSSLGLSGDQANNYVLYFENDSHVQAIVDSTTTITIYYLTSDSTAASNYIFITNGNISLIRSDFTIAKEYDNLTTLTKDAVSIVNRNDANGNGTAILYNSQSTMQILYGEFPDKEVSKNYSVDLMLFFPLGDDASEDSIQIAQTDSTIQVTLERVGGVLGVKVYMQGIGAEIKKRVLGVEDFATIDAVDRDYNSTSNITFAYTLVDGALAIGDEAYYDSSLISIIGHTKDNEVNVGTYDAIFDSYSIENNTFQKRYSVDISELNNYYSGIRQLDVVIDYAKLMPRIEFESREYSGSTNYTVSYVNKASVDVTALKTLNFSEELVNELKQFSYVPADVTYAYSKNGQNDGNVQVDANGNVVLHNVSVSGMTITETGGNNYLANYIVYGHRYNTTTEEYELVGTITSGLEIDKYEMLNVAGLTKRNLQIKANDIDVANKVYDGTKNASIKVQLTGSDAIAEDKPYLEVIATATYSRKQIGENIGVTIRVSELRVKEEYKDSQAALLNNYQLTAFTQKVSRSIMARPIDFSVSFNTRIYNGEESIAKNLIKYDLSSMLGDDSKNYSVNTDKGAYYLTKDINYTEYIQVKATDTFDETLTYYNSSKVAIEVTEETFADKVALGLYIDGFELLAKQGTAYNPILNNSKEKYINYELSVKSDKPLSDRALADLYAYETNDGEIYYGTGLIQVTASDTYVEGRTYYGADMKTVTLNNTIFEDNKASSTWYYVMNGVKYFYYKLPTTDKYIAVDDYNALNAEEKTAIDKSIIGFYIYYNSISNTNIKVYLLENSYSTSNVMVEAVSYVKGEGKVDRREVSVTAVSILNSEKLKKVYDGTTKYYGENSVDFTFGTGAIANDIQTDNLDVAEVSANFKTAQAGATQVVFVATRLTTKPGFADASFNYISTSATSTNKQATITKRSIYVTLADNEMIYGSQIASVKADMKFYLDEDCTKEIIITNDGWFVEYADFTEVCGLVVDKTNPAYIGDEYVEQLKAQRYDTTYTADVNGSLYKLAGTFVKPNVDIAVLGAKQNVGYIAERYALKGGNATNFTFVPKYTGNGKNGYSKLVVVKKTIYVVADATKEYTRAYGTDLTEEVKILFLNENGKEGIVSGETSYDIYTGSLTVVFKKVSVDDLANITFAPIVTARSLINETVGSNQGLPEGYIYSAYIVATNFESQNYDVKFGSIKVVDNQLRYEFEGTDFSSIVPQLTIVLPEIEDVTLASTEKELTYNGEDRAIQLVAGATSADVVTIDGSTARDVKVNGNNEAIAYTGDVVVTRTLLTNENEIDYIITKNLGTASLLINKASAGLTASKETVKYDGNKHAVSASSYGIKDFGINANPSNYTIEYYLDGVKIDTTKTSIINAGTYTYKVILESPNTNYISEEKSAQFVIAPATIEVIVDTSKLVQEYIAGKEYTITYEIVDTIGLGITKGDTEFKFYRKGKETTVTRAGRYNFVIGLTEDKDKEYNIRSNDEDVADIVNVVFVNNVGNLDLTVSEIDSYNKDEEKVANITLKNAGDSLLADEFTTRYVYSNNILAEDDLYWASIEQYMSLISDKIGAGAKLEAVVRMNLTYGVNAQTLNDKEAIVTVSLPTEITSLDGYALYTTTSTGNLVQLKASDYTVNSDGTITYTTKYLGSVVFVKLGDEPMSVGAATGIGVGVTLFVLLIAGTVLAVVIKKKKLNAMV